MRRDKALVWVVAVMMAVFVVVFCALPRSTYSELEKRELRKFPEFSWRSLFSGNFTAEVSNWFSDSEPYRDVFMTGSMKLKSLQAFKTKDAVTFHAPQDSPETVVDTMSVAEKLGDQRHIAEFHNNVDANAKMENAGVIVVGNAPDARALMAFKNKNKGEKKFAEMVNSYWQEFGPEVQVYCKI